MKYTKRIALALLCVMPKGQANNIYSHTFYSVIPQYKLITNLTNNLLIDQAHNNGRALKRSTLQLALFGGKSGKASDLRDYFLFDGKLGLNVAENPQQPDNGIPTPGSTQDLIAGDFNIQTVTQGMASTISINPQQTSSGIALSLRTPIGERFWGTMELPVVHVRNNLDFTETFTYEPLGARANGAVGFYNSLKGETTIPVATMSQAFQQNGMMYGRIDGVQKTTQLGEVNLKLGYDAIDRNDLYFSVYTGLSIPTGNKPKGIYMFEAIGGNNHHTGFSGGLYGQMDVREFRACKAWFGWSMEAEYLIHNTQVRSFDLKDKPWSRYMQVYANESDRVSTNPNANGLVTWGINHFTKQVKVKPGYNGTFNVNINLISDTWAACAGINTFLRSAESISLAQPWKPGTQLAGLNSTYGIAGGATIPGSTLPFRTINVLPNSNEPFPGTYYVQATDLDLNSAAHPTVRATTFYGTLGYYRTANHPQYFELGSSYEWGTQNTALHRWTLWTKVQLTF